MNPRVLEKYISRDEQLSGYKAYLDSIANVSVDIWLSPEKAKPDESRFGGVPLVSKKFSWPEHKEGEYRFLGQINFSEIRILPDLLPKSGLLSLFYAYDETGEIFWRDDGYVLGYFYSSISELTLHSQVSTEIKSKKIEFSTGVSIPTNKHVREDWPSNFDTDALLDLYTMEGYSDDYLLGYPSFNTLAYDPTPGDEWMSLLTLSSYDELEWSWHDVGKLMVFIEKDKLKAADFSCLKTDAG